MPKKETHIEWTSSPRNSAFNTNSQPITTIHQGRQQFGRGSLDMAHLLPRQIIDPNGIAIVGIMRLTDERDEFARMSYSGVVADADDLVFGGAQ